MKYNTARQLRPAEVDELVEAYRDGANVQQLAAQFGVYRSTAGKHLATQGIDTKPPALPPDDIPVAASLYELGWSLGRIARKFGISDNTVRSRLLDAGVEMRPQRGGRAAPLMSVTPPEAHHPTPH